MQLNQPSSKHAFSLVELSIVLVIVGLLVGGILSGQSLVRASELRNIITENQRYVIATQAFRDKYFGLPGDMTGATLIWGKDNTNCSGHTGTAATNGTCNGDGDNRVAETAPGGAGATAEGFQYWRQLALAGLIEGTYTGLAGAGGGSEAVISSNVPPSRLKAAGWSVRTMASIFAGNGNAYAGNYDNYFQYGTQCSGAATCGAVVTPAEAWNIDTKIDDGKPGVGKLVPRELAGWGGTNACTTSTSQTDYAGTYNLGNAGMNCSFYFRQQF